MDGGSTAPALLRCPAHTHTKPCMTHYAPSSCLMQVSACDSSFVSSSQCGIGLWRFLCPPPHTGPHSICRPFHCHRPTKINTEKRPNEKKNKRRREKQEGEGESRRQRSIQRVNWKSGLRLGSLHLPPPPHAPPSTRLGWSVDVPIWPTD